MCGNKIIELVVQEIRRLKTRWPHLFFRFSRFHNSARGGLAGLKF